MITYLGSYKFLMTVACVISLGNDGVFGVTFDKCLFKSGADKIFCAIEHRPSEEAVRIIKKYNGTKEDLNKSRKDAQGVETTSLHLAVEKNDVKIILNSQRCGHCNI